MIEDYQSSTCWTQRAGQILNQSTFFPQPTPALLCTLPSTLLFAQPNPDDFQYLYDPFIDNPTIFNARLISTMFIDPNMQAFLIGSLYFTLPLTFLILCLFCYHFYKKEQHRNRINAYRDRFAHIIDPSKIIVAVDPLQLFVQISNVRKSGFVELPIQQKWTGNYLQRIKRFFGFGVVYYKTRDKKQNIDFLKELLSTNKVELYLYTFLSEQVSESILKRLGLNEFFKRGHRLYCGESLKHPAEIDSNTKRVLILTGSREDFLEEDYKYFLVVRRNELKKYGRELSGLISGNEDVDDLHNEFVRWKINEFGDSSHQ